MKDNLNRWASARFPEEDYEALKAYLPPCDRPQMRNSYSEWIDGLNAYENKFSVNGDIVVHVDLAFREFFEWCQATKTEPSWEAIAILSRDRMRSQLVRDGFLQI
jgi:hypothetical protein